MPVKGRWRPAVSAHTTSTRTLVIALACEPRHRRVEVRRGRDYRILGDADRRRPQRRRFDQPAAADVGPPRGEKAARPPSSIRLRPRALFLELRRRRAGVLARRRRVDLRRHHPHRRARAGGVAADCLRWCCSSPSCSKAGRRSKRSATFRKAKGRWAGSRRCGGRRTRRPSSCCSKTARRWPASSPPRSASCFHRSPAIRSIDGAASVVIGIILGFTAMLLAYESKGLLIGEAADPVLVRSLHALACAKPGWSASATS